MSNDGSSKPDQTGRTDNDRLIFGLLRGIRADAQFLQKFLEENLEKAANLSSTDQAALMSQVLDRKLLTRIEEPILGNLKSIAELFQTDVREFEWCSDDVETIRQTWLQVQDVWPAAKDVTFDEQRRGLGQVLTCLDQIIFRCGSLTLSPLVNDMLENLRVGQPLDWDFAFGAQMPRDPELRKRLLDELAQEGGIFDAGVVDVDQRVIYKVAATRAQQRWSTVKLVFLVVICGVGVPWVLSRIGSLTNQ